MRKILIFMSDTGGGHRASAEALKAAFLERYAAQLHVDILDLWTDYAPWPLNLLPKSYRFMVDETPWLYKALWTAGESDRVIHGLMDVITLWAGESAFEAILKYDPDLIISVHPLLQEVPLKIMARKMRSTPFVTVVTDLGTFHPTWFHKEVALCFVPTEQGFQAAVQGGVDPSKIRQLGLPIRPVFACQPPPKTELRIQLGLHSNMPTVLVMGGGEGMGPVADIAQAIAARLAQDRNGHADPCGQMVVICGRNQELQDRLTAQQWAIPTQVHGFVTNMSDWMAASDCLVTKAGPGSIAEAMCRGLPVILSSFVPGQETGNISYVEDNRIGLYRPDPRDIAETVSLWFGPQRDQLCLMSDRARALARPNAVYDIADEIAGLLP